MVKALFDSNILIDALNGIEQAKIELARYADAAISVITWIEVAVKLTDFEKVAFQVFLDAFPITVLHTNTKLAEGAATIRASSFARPPRIRLPDAIIAATANISGRTVITRNPRDFGAANVHVPYEFIGGQIVNVTMPPA
jgi:predicted nucleic acid-binding protein